MNPTEPLSPTAAPSLLHPTQRLQLQSDLQGPDDVVIAAIAWAAQEYVNEDFIYGMQGGPWESSANSPDQVAARRAYFLRILGVDGFWELNGPGEFMGAEGCGFDVDEVVGF